MDLKSSQNDSVQAEISKEKIRKEVWDYLEKHNLVLFPRPVHGRIPNFKGCETAASKLADQEVFRKGSCIKVSPDKPQEGVRRHALQLRKTVLMPIPRLRSGLFVRLDPLKLREDQIRYASTANGARDLGSSVGLEAVLSIDVLVLGSVAVSPQGFRIGKGEGFADLEYAILMEMGAINESTPVITTVHDSQVYDDLPAHLFKEHDVLVDLIVTPTQVLHTSARMSGLSQPRGIIWNLLTTKQVNDMPILGILRRKYLQNGLDCSLKASSPFSLCISNIPYNMKIRELKDILASKGVKPTTITWHGASGSAVLHYKDGINSKNVNDTFTTLREIIISGNQLIVEIKDH